MNNLTQYQIKYGRRIFNIYNGLNSFSFALVTGNIITLYALFLGAGSVVVGLLGAFYFLAYFAIPVGKALSARKPLMRIFADTWILRNCSLLFMAAIPVTVGAGLPQVGLLLMIVSTLLFNFFRGVGMVANNPVLGDLAPGKDRGSYLVLVTIINNTAALAATLCMAFLLNRLPGLTAFSLAVITGIVFGFMASALLYRMPKPRHEQAQKPGNFVRNFLYFFKDRNFRMFLAAFSVIGFGVGMAKPFIVVYCREVYGQSDSVITIVSFFSILGALAMGGIARLFIDRIGAKPMYLLFSFISLVSLVLPVISPQFGYGFLIPVFLCIVAFLSNLGFAGEENAAQTYFFALIPRYALMDMSMVYYFILGGTGAVGSLFGGVILDGFMQSGFSTVTTYRIYFGMQILLIGTGLYLESRLQRLGSYPLKNAITMFFSPRDLRALNLLYRLDRSEDAKEETQILSELRESNTAAATDNLLQLLSSPSFAVRTETLNSMESLPRLSANAVTELKNELRKGTYTTAHIAARLLGKFRITAAIPELRQSLYSDDYVLAGEAMVALARIGDEHAQVLVGEILSETTNPHLLLWGIQAMQIFGNAASIPILQDMLRLDFEKEDVHHETILAFSALMGFEKRFYLPYSRYIVDPSVAPEILADLFEEVAAKKKIRDNRIPPLILEFLADREKAGEFTEQILSYARGSAGIMSAMMISSIIDTDMVRLESFRFFLCYWVIMLLYNKKLITR